MPEGVVIASLSSFLVGVWVGAGWRKYAYEKRIEDAVEDRWRGR